MFNVNARIAVTFTMKVIFSSSPRFNCTVVPSDINAAILDCVASSHFRKMDIKLYIISEIRCLDPKFGTWKVFGTRKPILASDFDSFQVSVNYNAMSSGQKSSKILKIGIKSQKIDVLTQNLVPDRFSGRENRFSPQILIIFKFPWITMQYLHVKNHGEFLKLA